MQVVGENPRKWETYEGEWNGGGGMQFFTTLIRKGKTIPEVNSSIGGSSVGSPDRVFMVSLII